MRTLLLAIAAAGAPLAASAWAGVGPGDADDAAAATRRILTLPLRPRVKERPGLQPTAYFSSFGRF